MDRQAVAAGLTAALELDMPVIAVAFVDEAPQGMPVSDAAVPSACSFWRLAEGGSFYAPADKHFNCPVGAMTMGFDMPESVQQELMGAVTRMMDCGYVSADEPTHIPTIQSKPAGIAYGPLPEFPLDPDVILLWLTPRQAMLFSEATGNSRWPAATPLPVLGRPACAALPLAMAQAHAALSLGCMGMRTFTAISGDRMLAVLPAATAGELVTKAAATAGANQTMRGFYEERKAAFGR
jgi:uncharacterized protein (DUF169 family)